MAALMAYGLWLMAYGLWPMAYGLWLMAYGLWLKMIRDKRDEYEWNYLLDV